MNIFRWFSNSMNDDYKNDTFDYTILVPVTIGLGSILASFLHYKYGLFCSVVATHFKTTSNDSRQEMHRLSALKKKPKSMVGKSETAKTTADYVDSKTIVDSKVNNSHSAKSFEKVKDVPDVSHPQVVVTVTETIQTVPAVKKLKKMKHLSPIEVVQTQKVEEPVEVDTNWVVVTSRKAKHSTNKSAISKSAQKDVKLKRNEESTLSTLPFTKSPTPKKEPTPNKTDTFFSPVPPVVPPQSPVSSPKADSPPVDITHLKVPLRVPSPTVMKKAHADSLGAFVGVTNKHCTTSASHLPATTELLSHNNASQLKAKEAECQILRSEVIHLRDELKSMKMHFVDQISLECAKPPVTTSDIGLMTEVEHAPSSPDYSTNRHHQHQPQQTRPIENSTEAILLTTFQAEIADLTKHLNIYRQRSELFKSRFELTNKKLSDLKSQKNDEIKMVQQTLDNHVQRLANLEAIKVRMEYELNEALQKAEVHRRKSEESEYNSTQRLDELEHTRHELDNLRKKFKILDNSHKLALEERERFVLKYDDLVANHSKTLTELATIQSKCNMIQLNNESTESRLKLLASEHQHELHQMSQMRQDDLTKFNDLAVQHEAALAELATRRAQVDSLEVELHQLSARATMGQLHAECQHDLDGPTKTMVDVECQCEGIADEVKQYKMALDATEAILSKLQTSVDTEETRWRKALDAANVENELLRAKAVKLEAALNELMIRSDEHSEELDATLDISNGLSNHVAESRSKSDKLTFTAELQPVWNVDHASLDREQVRSSQLQTTAFDQSLASELHDSSALVNDGGGGDDGRSKSEEDFDVVETGLEPRSNILANSTEANGSLEQLSKAPTCGQTNGVCLAVEEQGAN